ncbi:MAG: hypothetical protein HYT50_02540 [Candidatus Wildermuthbacteria bacterium]|nr:hypothetical protein [Candidatus Wildermuthbacteria bacterium]
MADPELEQEESGDPAQETAEDPGAQEQAPEAPQQTGNQVSILDPDFLVFAMPFALIIDVLDFFLEFGTFVSLIAGAPLIWWMVARAGKTVDVQDLKQKQAQQQAAKTAGRKALRRGIIVFVAELIPLLNLLPFWTITLFALLRNNTPVPVSEERDTMKEPTQANA